MGRPRLRSITPAVAVLLVLGLVLFTSSAHAELRMKWDCYLPTGGVDCVVLESSLVSKIRFLRVVRNVADADVAVAVTSVPAENGTRVRLDFVGREVDGYATEVHTTDKIPSSIDSPTATMRILTKLQRGLDDFMDQKIAAEMEDGALVMRLLDPVSLPFTGRPEQGSLKWYVTPAIGSYFSEVEGVGINASGTASVSFNYSERRWRLQQSIGTSYNQASQPVPGTTETASVSFVGFNGTNTLGWSLTADQKWNAGLLFSGEKNPQANYRARANVSVGLEFDLVPRQTVNQKNFGFRCALGPEVQRYDAPNVQGRDQQAIARQFCDLFLSWHFAPIDVWASLGETSVLEDFDYRSFTASLSATWRVTDNFTISPWVTVQQVNAALNEAEPTNAVYADPKQEIEASLLAAVESGYTAPFGIQSGLSLRYLFGNGSLSFEDQRWARATNLR